VLSPSAQAWRADQNRLRNANGVQERGQEKALTQEAERSNMHDTEHASAQLPECHEVPQEMRNEHASSREEQALEAMDLTKSYASLSMP